MSRLSPTTSAIRIRRRLNFGCSICWIALNQRVRNLLLIDDNEMLGHTLRIILGNKYQITVCHTGRDGLRRAEEVIPDAIICDLRLPDIHGSEVVKRLQANPATRAIPIIIITGDPHVDKALTDSFCVIRKPFTADQIRTALVNASRQPEETQ